MKKKSDKKELKQFLIFTVAEKQFTIELDYITEIGEYLDIMVVPRAKKYVLGVINLRGIIVPVISLRKRFKLSEDKITKDTGLIYIKKDDVMYGILVDKIEGIEKISSDKIGEVPKIFKENIDIAYFKGMFELNKQKIIILNTDSIFE
ncbi:MAG: hypothetical protein GWP03_00910 [Proteobacteria bacterium]|nr:hypothetical protein [Pseudomonadota bacterium]